MVSRIAFITTMVNKLAIIWRSRSYRVSTIAMVLYKDIVIVKL
jgi:hypothetical protein